MQRTVYDLWHWVAHSKNALAISSLSAIGYGHPFIPSDSPLYQVFGRDAGCRCRIVAQHMDTDKIWPPSEMLKMQMLLPINHAGVSPDGNRLAISCGGIVHVLDAVTGTTLLELVGHTSSVSFVAFSPDSRRLASGSSDGVCVWDVATGRCLRKLAGHTSHRDAQSVAFSPDGRHIALASYEFVHVWDVATGRSLQKPVEHTSMVYSVTFSPDAHLIASASFDQMRVWDAVTGVFLQEFEGHAENVACVAFSPDGHSLAAALRDCTVHVWDVASGKSLQSCSGYPHWMESIVFTPDGRLLACAKGNSGYSPPSNSHILYVWDAAMRMAPQELKAHDLWVHRAAFSPDGHHLVCIVGDSTVHVWDIAMGPPLQEFKGHTDTVTSIAFSWDGCHLASASGDHTVQVWDAISGTSITQMDPMHFSPCGISFALDGLMLKVEGESESRSEPCASSYLHFPSLETIRDLPPSLPPFIDPIQSPFYLDRNSLCIRSRDVILHICWLPDYFKPTTLVAQNGNHVCIGGEEGMIAFINLDGLRMPKL